MSHKIDIFADAYIWFSVFVGLNCHQKQEDIQDSKDGFVWLTHPAKLDEKGGGIRNLDLGRSTAATSFQYRKRFFLGVQ